MLHEPEPNVSWTFIWYARQGARLTFTPPPRNTKLIKHVGFGAQQHAYTRRDCVVGCLPRISHSHLHQLVECCLQCLGIYMIASNLEDLRGGMPDQLFFPSSLGKKQRLKREAQSSLTSSRAWLIPLHPFSLLAFSRCRACFRSGVCSTNFVLKTSSSSSGKP